MSSPGLFASLTAPNGRQYNQPLGLFINNEWVSAKSGQRIQSIDPFTEKEIAQVHAAGKEDVDIAVAAARKAFQGPWRTTSSPERGNLLNRLASLIEAQAETFATIESWDSGKPYAPTLESDMGEVLSTFRFYAGYADKLYGQVMDDEGGRHVYTLREPIGVCGQIIPWNFSLLMAAWKLAPALATGNCVVMKAAELTPLSVLYLADLVKEAGFPPGVVNIINGYGQEAGSALAGHMDVDKIAFTGSTGTARAIQRAAASNLKNIALETGGKSPMIIFEDADLEKAAYWAHQGINFNAGQNCTANSRIFAHESIRDEFIKHFKEQVRKSPLGDPFHPNTFQGPQISAAQRDKVLGYIASGKEQGAEAVVGGRAWIDPKTGAGFFVEPTLFSNVTDDMRIYREEIFGPVATISSFKTEEEAVRRGNDTIFGLGAAVFTRDLSRTHRLAKQIESGTIWVNSSQDSNIRTPFGGVKQSGIGRECGQAGIEAYTSLKSVFVTLDTARL